MRYQTVAGYTTRMVLLLALMVDLNVRM